MQPPPIASPFGDEPVKRGPFVPQNLRWDNENGCFCLAYQSPIRGKLRCLPKELRRSPLQIVMLFATSPLFFITLAPFRLPLLPHVLLALLMSPLVTFLILLVQWNLNKVPGLVMIRREGLVDQFPSKTAFYPWPDIKRTRNDEGDLFFNVSSTKGSYFPREAFATPAERDLFFFLVERMVKSQGSDWHALVQKFGLQMMR